jgi:tetratricopeptide (TPR) repeat protein
MILTAVPKPARPGSVLNSGMPAMTFSHLTASSLALSLLISSALQAQPGRGDNKPGKPGQARAKPASPAPADAGKARETAPGKLPLSNLAPAVLVPNLCVVKYRISTASPKCQEFFDQGLGYFYSYVWMEAARSFETALQHDPDCAMAWWGLARALERWAKKDQGTKALLKAGELRSKASWRESQLILASLQERGQVPGVGDAEARKKAAITTLDGLLAVHDDDEEAWYARAQLASGSALFGGQVAGVPFYKALLQINPLHPGANHELVHFYENFKRPALGWPYAEKYIESSPGLPHAFHMQAHLGTRIGRWDKTSNYSARAIELEQAYHKVQNVKPREDHQYQHHLETLLVSLIHDGRFREGRVIKEEMIRCGYKSQLTWFRLHLAERDWAEALKIAEQVSKNDKTLCSYMRALVHLKQGLPVQALPDLEVLQHAYAENKSDKKLEFRVWEVQGLYLVQAGAADAGLKLLLRAVEKTKNDYSHHAWGNGASYMEQWGLAGLQARKYDVAEEAYLEALAHDSGSVRAALGLQVMCEYLGRTEEAQRYADLARRCWNRADPQRLEQELAALRAEQLNATVPTGKSASN